jgi:Family of unknown function (DUF6188)
MLDLIPRDEGWLLPVEGQRVTRCCIDSQGVLVLCENLIEIAISEPFTLVTSSGSRYVLDPAPSTGPASLAPILQVMWQIIGTGTAFNDGRLELGFRNGSWIGVPAGKDFEAWTLAGPGGIDGLKIVSIPGGELAIWSDRR